MPQTLPGCPCSPVLTAGVLGLHLVLSNARGRQIERPLLGVLIVELERLVEVVLQERRLLIGNPGKVALCRWLWLKIACCSGKASTVCVNLGTVTVLPWLLTNVLFPVTSVFTVPHGFTCCPPFRSCWVIAVSAFIRLARRLLRMDRGLLGISYPWNTSLYGGHSDRPQRTCAKWRKPSTNSGWVNYTATRANRRRPG